MQQTTDAEVWQLVWRYERSHKVELEPLRLSLTETVEKAKGSLVCLKKATGFGRWLSRKPNIPFVLLAHWREAKPCWDAICQENPTQLQFTVGYTEQETQYKQASWWAASQRARGCRNAIHVVPMHVEGIELASCVVKAVHLRPMLVLPPGFLPECGPRHHRCQACGASLPHGLGRSRSTRAWLGLFGSSGKLEPSCHTGQA